MKTQNKARMTGLNRATLAATAAALTLTLGCATTSTQFSHVQSELPAIRDGYARVFFYRPDDDRDTAQYEVRLDGAIIGTVAEGEIFHYDLPSGSREVKVVSDHREQVIQIDASAGGTEFYKISSDQVDRSTASANDSSRASLRYVRAWGRYFPAQLRNTDSRRD